MTSDDGRSLGPSGFRCRTGLTAACDMGCAGGWSSAGHGRAPHELRTAVCKLKHFRRTTNIRRSETHHGLELLAQHVSHPKTRLETAYKMILKPHNPSHPLCHQTTTPASWTLPCSVRVRNRACSHNVLRRLGLAFLLLSRGCPGILPVCHLAVLPRPLGRAEGLVRSDSIP